MTDHSRERDRAASAIEALVLVAGCLALLAVALPAWHLSHSRTDGIESVRRWLEACQRAAERGDLALVGHVSGGLLLIWGFAVLVRLSGSAVRDLGLIQRTSRTLARQSEEVELFAGGKTLHVRLLPGPGHVALTAGLLWPRVYLSRPLWRTLLPTELQAVLLHEAAHARARDPLRCWLANVVARSLWWPGAASLGRCFAASREAAADRSAVAGLGDDRPLLAALLKVDALGAGVAACALTRERSTTLRQVREHGARVSRREVLGVAAALSVIGILLVVTVAGLSDWQLYGVCPDCTPIVS